MLYVASMAAITTRSRNYFWLYLFDQGFTNRLKNEILLPKSIWP